jgi:mono/diheme cytochrome c family protein
MNSLTRLAVRIAGAAAVLAAVLAAAPEAAAQGNVDWNQYKKQVGEAPRDTLDANTYAGWKQYELNCSRCHGEFGVGSSFAPALIVSLKDNGTIPDQASFVSTVCQGRKEKGMPSWCELGLEMDKIMNIYSYLKLRADGKVHPGRPASKG